MSDRSEYWREYARTHREQRREIERRRDAKRKASRGPIVMTCVGCGVAFTPHSNVQKFCTAECRKKSHEPRITKRETRTTTMEIETDHVETELRGQSVGYRTCIICGKTFAKDMQHPKRQKCPECVFKDGRCSFEEKTPASFREQKRCEEIEEKKRLERIRKRDAAWARWERENGVKSRIEDHGTFIVEIRGQSCIGCHAVSSVKHT